MAIRGLLFDKDGTLFDFNSTWGRWTAEVIREFTTDATLQGRLARRLGRNSQRKSWGGTRRNSRVSLMSDPRA